MPVRLANLPPALLGLVPEGWASKDADLVVIDGGAIGDAKDGSAALLQAYARLSGAELVTLEIAALPPELHAPAKALAGADATHVTGAAVLAALDDAPAQSAEVRAHLPALAERLHEQMGKEHRSAGLLTKGLPQKRATQAELSQWFAASVAEIRESAGGSPIDRAGGQRLLGLTKKAILNSGTGILVRSFFEQAARDLAATPGFTDEAMAAIQELKLFTRQEPRNEQGMLVRRERELRRATELDLLNETQRSAVLDVVERQKPPAAQARAALITKIAPWGYSEADLDGLIAYLRDYAPVTIQFHPDKALPGGKRCIESFLEDPVYKNQFQTKISSGSLCPTAGSSRDNWERNLFNGKYHTHPLIPEERPKYGGLSPLNNPQGNGGDHYGKCFFELRQDVKFRTTFTPRNSSGCRAVDVSHIDVIEVLLNQISSNAEYLKKMFHVARGESVSLLDRYPSSYIEAQVHGDLQLDQDVAALVIDTSYVSTPYYAQLVQLAKKLDVPIKLTDRKAFSFPD